MLTWMHPGEKPCFTLHCPCSRCGAMQQGLASAALSSAGIAHDIHQITCQFYPLPCEIGGIRMVSPYDGRALYALYFLRQPHAAII